MHSQGMPGTGFTSVSDYLGANQDTVAREANDLAGDVSGQIAGARSAADAVAGGVQPGGDFTTAPGYLDALGRQNAALDSAQGLQTQGGIADLLQKQQAKDPGYTQGKAFWDAGLLGGAAPFGAVKKQADGLQGYLDGAGAAAGAKLPTDTAPDTSTAAPTTEDAPTRDPYDPRSPVGPGTPGGAGGKDWTDPTAPWNQHKLPAPRPFGQPAEPNPYPGSLGEYLEGGP